MSHLLMSRSLNRLVRSAGHSNWNYLQIIKRTVLSSTYACNDVWSSQRKECETLKHIASERFFFELNQKYQQKQNLTPVDVDIYINSVYKPENREELEHIVRLFRASKLSANVMESTHHAICRYYLGTNNLERLIEVLNNRHEFGVFPNVYTYNIIIDTCLKAEKIEYAFETVKLMMLQEDAGNYISKVLAIHTLQRVFEDGIFGMIKREEPKTEAATEGEEEKAEEEDDDDIEYIRIPFIENKFFDDHFDLTDKAKIWGKSLNFFAKQLEASPEGKGNETLINNAKIMGLIAHEKFSELGDLLQQSIEIVPETLELVEAKLKNIGETLEAEKNKPAEENAEKKKDENAVNIEELEKGQKLLQQIQNMNKSSETFKLLTDNIVKNIGNFEQADISEQMKCFAQFEKERFTTMKEQLDRILHEQRRQEIEAKKEDLEKKKKLYYFFENFAKHEIDFVNAEERIKDIQSKTIVEENYIPPETR